MKFFVPKPPEQSGGFLVGGILSLHEQYTFAILSQPSCSKITQSFSNPTREASSCLATLRSFFTAFKTAEGVGFEPTRGFKAPTSLAVRRFRPLSQPSNYCLILAILNPFFNQFIFPIDLF